MKTPNHPSPQPPPALFIGMPVYNEQQFITDALSDLIHQDYPHFTLLISDNGSTDGTSEIGQGFANQHDNVEYQRLDTNIGAAGNFQRVLEQADGRYFMWASGHDRWDANYLSECVQLLEANPKASLAFGTGDWIDADGTPSPRQCGWTDTCGMNPIARYFSVIWGNMHPILGVIRLAHLRQAQPLKATTGADLILLTELALMGDFVHAIRTHWHRRDYRGDETYAQKLKRYRSPRFGLTRSRFGRLFPLAALPLELIKVIFRAPLSIKEKLMLSFALPPTFLVKYLSSRK